MEYSPEFITYIRDDPNYQEQRTRSCYAAVNAYNSGITKPPLIVDDKLIEFNNDVENGNKYCKWFSNHARSPFTIGNERNDTVEHYYECQKLVISEHDPEVVQACQQIGVSVEKQVAENKATRDFIRTLRPSSIPFSYGSGRRIMFRPDWDQIRDEVMWNGLVAKFTQNNEFRNVLKSAGDRVIVYRESPGNHWSVNYTGDGKNVLGIMLMALRLQLIEHVER